MKIFLFCPIPEEQKPINNYIRLKEENNINWTLLTPENYKKKVTKIFFVGILFSFLGQLLFLSPKIVNFFFFQISSCWNNFLVCTKGVVFIPNNQFISQIFENSFLFLTVFFFCFFRFWKEINNTLQQSYLLYEEGSWYEIERWEKPLFLIKNDRLLGSQRVSSIQARLLNSFMIFLSLFLGIFLVSFLSK